ncbi:MAG: hypothetical protein UZ22_OP11002000697 [Microgenomates bacterium OLB23]|nr:MAG: hypothetical protein UZ22_OP11002000697 [Microgenomates bacterium OLB23]
MPSRKDTFENGHYYHVYNKTIDDRAVFLDPRLSNIFLQTMEFYLYNVQAISFSTFRRMALNEKLIHKDKFFKYPIVKLVAYTLMPNHYHFLLRQQCDNGIQTFMSKLINSFTRYFNNLIQRKGPLFLTQFNSVQILTQNQLIYTSRYIHLNPVKARLCANVELLKHYKWTSYLEYMGMRSTDYVSPEYIMVYFKHNPLEYLEYLRLKKS